MCVSNGNKISTGLFQDAQSWRLKKDEALSFSTPRIFIIETTDPISFRVLAIVPTRCFEQRRQWGAPNNAASSIRVSNRGFCWRQKPTTRVFRSLVHKTKRWVRLSVDSIYFSPSLLLLEVAVVVRQDFYSKRNDRFVSIRSYYLVSLTQVFFEEYGIDISSNSPGIFSSLSPDVRASPPRNAWRVLVRADIVRFIHLQYRPKRSIYGALQSKESWRNDRARERRSPALLPMACRI